MKNKNTNRSRFLGEKITRKEVLKKTGLTALTASTLFFLETKSAAASSTIPGAPDKDTDSSIQTLGGTSGGTARPDR